MIHITVEKSGGRYRGITSRGHAMYGEHGEDILCAAVSALLINTVNSLDQLTQDEYTVDEGGPEDGYLSLSLGDELSDKGKLLLDSLMLGLHSVLENYGDTYLFIEERERDMI